MTRACFNAPAPAATYVLGDWDRATEKWTAKTLTLVSRQTNTRYTDRISRPPGEDVERNWIVLLLTGPNNETDFTYMGLLRPQGINALVVAEDAEWPLVRLQHTAKSAFPTDSKPWKAFGYFTRQVLQHGNLPEALEVWHEGRCGRCGRKLTTPQSVETGFGPVCAERL